MIAEVSMIESEYTGKWRVKVLREVPRGTTLEKRVFAKQADALHYLLNELERK